MDLVFIFDPQLFGIFHIRTDHSAAFCADHMIESLFAHCHEFWLSQSCVAILQTNYVVPGTTVRTGFLLFHSSSPWKSILDFRYFRQSFRFLFLLYSSILKKNQIAFWFLFRWYNPLLFLAFSCSWLLLNSESRLKGCCLPGTVRSGLLPLWFLTTL